MDSEEESKMGGRSKAKRYTFVQFYSRHLGFVSYSFRRVSNRDPVTLYIPEDVFALRFFDLLLTENTVKIIKEYGILHCRRLNLSPKYFCGGKVYGLVDLKKKLPKNKASLEMIERVRHTKSRKAILSRDGHWYYFGHKDILLKMEK